MVKLIDLNLFVPAAVFAQQALALTKFFTLQGERTELLTLECSSHSWRWSNSSIKNSFYLYLNGKDIGYSFIDFLRKN